ncbi:hypothetical protein AD998_04670 [bacterium 336/3]|nr:hypothetical protein AD998_04670 [bacterium 336/3]
MAKIFITGATGFVGEQLAKKLVKQGNEVHLLARSVSKAKKMFPDEQFKIFEGDLLEPTKIQKAIENCSEVYHLAAYAKVWDKDPQAFYKMNVEGTLHILEKALEAGIERVVLTSTAGVLGPAVNGIVTENTPQTVPHSTEYERTKAISEQESLKYLDKGLEIVTLNPTRIYGGGQRSESNAVTKLLERYHQGKWRIMPGDGKRIGNYVFVEDVVQGHILAMQKGRNGERYILGGDNVSYQELFDMFGEITGKHLRLFNLPIGVMMTFARLQLFIANTFGKAPLITPNFVKKYLYDWKVSSEKAQKELGYQITPLKQGLSKTLEWLKGNP